MEQDLFAVLVYRRLLAEEIESIWKTTCFHPQLT